MNFQLARNNMIEQQVRPWHVFNKTVLTAMSEVPREKFVPVEYLDLAYSDTDIPLSDGQTMLSPKVVGRALQALALTGQEKILELGTGTGYVTACLSKLAATVISVEILPAFITQAEKNLSAMNARNILLQQGDAVFGWQDQAPYDAIIITGSYPMGVPAQICDMLHPNHGRLFAICGLKPAMQAILIARDPNRRLQTSVLFETSAPALIHAPQPEKFKF